MVDEPRHAKLYARDPAGAEPGLTPEPPRDSVGVLLRRTREQHGQDLREVSDSLRIRYAYLDAIERSAFEELPGPTYAIGFVRGYAQHMNLDDDEIVRRFKAESQGIKRDQELHFPAPVNEGKLPGGTILVLSLVLIALAYGAWAFLSSDERSVADLVPEVPQRLQDLVGVDDQPEVSSAGDLGDSLEVGGAAEPAVPTEGTAAAGDAASSRAETPETGTPDQAPATGGDASESVASVPDAPKIPEGSTSPGTAGSSATTAGPLAAGQSASGAPESTGPQTANEQTANEQASSEPAANGASPAPDAAATPQAPDTNAADAAQGAGAGRAGPPAVPGSQTADDGIPAAPDNTRSVADAAQSGRAFGADPTNSRVTLRATADSWVQVRGPEDSLVLTRMLRPGDVYRVPDRPGLLLHTGNAGGLQVLVDGTDLGTLGEDGEVRRGIVLEPDALETR